MRRGTAQGAGFKALWKFEGACQTTAEICWFSDKRAPGSGEWGGAKPAAAYPFLNNPSVFGALEVVSEKPGTRTMGIWAMCV